MSTLLSVIASLGLSANPSTGWEGPMLLFTVHGYEGPEETICRMTFIRYAYPDSEVECVILDQDGIFHNGFET